MLWCTWDKLEGVCTQWHGGSPLTLRVGGLQAVLRIVETATDTGETLLWIELVDESAEDIWHIGTDGVGFEGAQVVVCLSTWTAAAARWHRTTSTGAAKADAGNGIGYGLAVSASPPPKGDKEGCAAAALWMARSTAARRSFSSLMTVGGVGSLLSLSTPAEPGSGK